MPEGQVLEFTHVTKRFNEVTAVSDFSARVEPGAVTAFLGPNGAGKTTTLRILLGQVRATSGTATIGGTAFAELRQPLRTIGSVLEETVYRPRRTAERQLTIAAKANGIPLARVGEVLSLVGLDGEGDSRIGGFSLGMRQRLSVAHALLGDPGALVFDEPANGLDPEGIRWMRLLMRRLADEGRTVLVSSHVLSEVEQVADNVLVLSKGQLVLASGIETLADPKGGSVIVDAADRGALTAALSAAGFDIEVLRSGLTVRGGDAGTVGAVAADAGIALSTLVQRGPTLEDVFIDLMRGGRLSTRIEDAAPQLAAPATAAPVTAEVDGPADDVADAPVGPVDSVVAIPVAAAAAWAAEAAAAPEGEDVADDLAASVAAPEATAEEAPAEDTEGEPTEQGSADVTSADEPSVEETPADAAPADAAPTEDTQDETAAEESPAPSFDQILFGAAAPVAAVEPTPAEDVRDSVAEIFTTPPTDADEPEQAPDHVADAGSESDASSADDAPSEDEAASEDETVSEDEAASEDDHAGVEIFADLDAASESGVDDAASSADGDTRTDEESDGEESDPRSAAVSSMLAAAARAYYEDEPRDYPLSSDGQEAGEDTATEGAHWSVASTGVIDTVPLEADDSAAEAEHGSDSAGAPADDEHADDASENPAGEHHDGERHDGDNHHG
jgi:ABC-2 type transport system ATP-binding protein